ncbi:MAG: FlgD immunoglobulin-like domain containing protein, partial [Bacteroidota bacterium]|nr:FlgD immunoglobulin-like domain containing protein [Bacteroidota bacterium]
ATNGSIKVFNASDNTLYQDITINDDYVKEMFIAPDQKLYVLANMYNEDGESPQLYIFRHDDATGGYEQITVSDITMPTYENDFLYHVGNFCYVPQKQSLYITISPNDTTQIIPYQSIQNTKLHIESPFSQTNSMVLEINNDQIVGSSPAIYARKMICPDAINPDQASQYNDKLFILGNTLLILDYTQPLSATYPTDNPGITSIQLEDATYSPFHDKVFGFQDINIDPQNQGLRKADIKYIDGSGNSESLGTGDHCDGQAAGIFYNPYDHYLYLYKWIDNPKLGDEQCRLLCFDPGLYPGNIFLESVDLDNTSFFPDYCHNDDAHWKYYHITGHYIDPVSNEIYIANGGHSNVSRVGFIPNEPLQLDNSDWTWLSFPRLDRDGGNPSPHEVLYGSSGENIDPSNYLDNSQLKNLPPNSHEMISNIYEFDNNFWNPIPGGLFEVFSERGYKLNLLYNPQPPEKWLFMSGTQLDPGESITIYGQYDNWVGYWLTESQSPFDAIPENVLDELSKITAQSWVCIKRNLHRPESDHYWTCAIHEDPVRLDYGDMVILNTIEDGTQLSFQWQRYGNPPMEEERDEPDYFQYNEQASYTPFLIELDTSNNPIEIGAFVDDTCVGATTVLSTDTIILVPGYIDTLSGEVTFQQYYGSLKAEPEKYNEYHVWDNQTNILQQRTIHTNENQDYYLISFKKEQKKNNPEIGLWINCKPNPFSHSCQINYYIPERCEAAVIIYDLFGHKMKVLQEGVIPKGMHSTSFDGTDSKGFSLPDGIYIIKLKAGKLHVHRKVIKIN